MEIAVTNGITVAVEVAYLDEHSSPREDRFLFAYFIHIENGSPYTVQLMGRHWYIQDGANPLREVKGDGVIGEQPVIAPGETFEYQSYCEITTEIGKMHGYYIMNRQEDDILFHVSIPEFKLIDPSILN